jgi:D-alanyl-D-alanine carboxypeptidase
MGIKPLFWPACRAAATSTVVGALAVLFAILTALPAFAASKSAVLVVDANTGRDLHASAADEPRHPASLTKMMTIYMAFELIEQGRLSYQTKLKISATAAATAPTKLDLDEGEEITLIDAIKALITKSANDMAVAIAEHIAGSEERFAQLMTQRARQLGMTSTVFKNASGLPDEDQITTARDMIKLALHLQDDFPKHYPLFATRTFTYKDETLHNHNTMLENYEGTDGIKTGYTRASGFNLVVSVRRGKKHVVGAIFGGASAAARNAAMRTFLNMGLVKASAEKTRQAPPGRHSQDRRGAGAAPRRAADTGGRSTAALRTRAGICD